MKRLFMLSAVAMAALSFSSCCCFPNVFASAGTKTVKVRACGYDTVTEQVAVNSDAKGGLGSKGGMTETVERKVPRYRTVKKRIWCGSCVRYYCPKKDCCGTTSKQLMDLATAQGGTGSPHIGLIPTMKNLAP